MGWNHQIAFLVFCPPAWAPFDIAFGAVQKRRPVKFKETRMPDAHKRAMPSSEPPRIGEL